MFMILEGLVFIRTGAGGNGNAVDFSLDEFDTADIVVVEIDTDDTIVVDGGKSLSVTSKKAFSWKLHLTPLDHVNIDYK